MNTMQVKRDENTAQESKSACPNNPSLESLIARIAEGVDTSDLLHPAIETIREYDAKSQSNLLHTLDVYLLNDCNAQHCGRLLFLHRNSLVYRIHRIQEIAGIDLSDPEERSYLRLSFLLWKAQQQR